MTWNACKFLESNENLKYALCDRFGRVPSTSQVREIIACLQQGRLFYEAAASAPLEIRPLQLFYGMVGFAKALICSYKFSSLATLPQTHGIKDTSASNSRIEDLRVKIGQKGIFQEFNNVIAELNRFCFFDDSNTPQALYIRSAKADQIADIEMSLKELLSRIPKLESIYRNTFQEDANVDQISFYNPSNGNGYWDLRIEDPKLFVDRESLREIVSRWRIKYQFLKKWSLVSADHCWGHSNICFGNVSNAGIDEFGEDFLVGDGNRYEAKTKPYETSQERLILSDSLPPLAGGYNSAFPYTVAPFNDLFISEFSFQFLSLFLLSSLVRYRPKNWVHALTKAVYSEAPADDRCLALIETFLDLNSASIPSLVVEVLNPNEDKYTRRSV